MIRKGTYVLFLTIPGADADVGALGRIHLPPGRYCYVGSAMGGLDQRIGRHLAPQKKIRWHIDRLTVICTDAEAYESYPDPISECGLADLAEKCGAVPFADGFGCSDCGCRTHLFLLGEGSEERIITSAGLKKHTRSQPPH